MLHPAPHQQAFHGTYLEALHSIIHVGLQNLSGTTLQRNGAIYGKGIYLTTKVRAVSVEMLAHMGTQMHTCSLVCQLHGP